MVLLAALTLAAAAHAAPAAAAPSFEDSLLQIRRDGAAASAELIKQEDLKKADKNVSLTASQAEQGRSSLASLLARAQTTGSDPMLSGELMQLEQDLDVYAQNCATVRKQVQALAQAAVKDPTLVALAQKLYAHSRVLDSDAGYLAIDARNDNAPLSVAGYGGQAYQIQRLAFAGADATPDVRVAAKSVLDKVQ